MIENNKHFNNSNEYISSLFSKKHLTTMFVSKINFYYNLNKIRTKNKLNLT